MHGSTEAELEVQRTIKRAELTALFCLRRKVIGATKVHVDNKGIIDRLPSPPLGVAAFSICSVRWCCLVSSFFGVFPSPFAWCCLVSSLFGWCCCFSFSCSVWLSSLSSFGWGCLVSSHAAPRKGEEKTSKKEDTKQHHPTEEMENAPKGGEGYPMRGRKAAPPNSRGKTATPPKEGRNQATPRKTRGKQRQVRRIPGSTNPT